MTNYYAYTVILNDEINYLSIKSDKIIATHIFSVVKYGDTEIWKILVERPRHCIRVTCISSL